jgi:hypothetical protein
VYGKNVVFLVEFEIETLKTALSVNLDLTEAQKKRLEQLNELDEKRSTSLHQTFVIQQQCSKWHDRFIKKKIFQNGDWALLYDSRFKDFKGKLQTRWLSPYKVDTIFDNGTVKLTTIDDAKHQSLQMDIVYDCINDHCQKKNLFLKSLADSGYHFFDGEEISPAPSKS